VPHIMFSWCAISSNIIATLASTLSSHFISLSAWARRGIHSAFVTQLPPAMEPLLRAAASPEHLGRVRCSALYLLLLATYAHVIFSARCISRWPVPSCLHVRMRI